MNKTGWIIQLRAPEQGARYYTARGKNVTNERDKAKVFSTEQEAKDKMDDGTLWPDRKVIPY